MTNVSGDLDSGSWSAYGVGEPDDCDVCAGYGGTYHPNGEWITCNQCGGIGLDCD